MKQTYRKYLSFLLFCVISLISFATKAYIVNSVTGEVTVRIGEKISKVKKGDKLKKNTMLSIPVNALIKILDETTGKEYTSVTTGIITVDELITESSKEAKDNAAQVNSTVALAAPRGKVALEQRVYRDKGMVTRSLNQFDEEGSKIEIAPEALAQLIAYNVYFEKEAGDTSLFFRQIPDQNEPGYGSSEEFGFKLLNPLDTPVYFNVLKFYGITQRQAEISSLGQPGGFYILPSGHSIWRAGKEKRPFDERHVIVACHYSFDIDALVEALNTIINDDERMSNFPDINLPVFIKQIR